MKRIFTLTLCLMQSILMMAAEPTVPSSNFVFSNIDGTKFTIRFTQGNGANRIVVMKAGSPITGTPVNGVDYTANNAFGTLNTLFTSASEYVVYKGNGNTFNVSNLLPATTYYISVFEYNGNSVTTQYLLVALTGSQATVNTPSTQTHTISFTNIIGNAAKINWVNGSGEGRLIIARKSSAVNASPTDLTDYSASADFGSGSVLNANNYVVYKSTGNNITINNLEPNTNYHFAFFEKNGSTSPMYLRPAATANFTTNAGPTIQTQGFSFGSQEGNRFTINGSRGNGSRRIYIMRKASAVTAVPVNGINYLANTAFGTGQEIAPGEFVVSNSTESLVTITNLEPATQYYVRSFEFDIDAAGNTYYLTSSPLSGSYSTASTPSPVTNVNFQNVTGNSVSIRYTAGNGGYRMVMMRESAPVNATPQNLIRYNGNPTFGTGELLPTGNYIVNGGANGTITNVTNLKPGFTYHVAVYEFSGNNYPVYGPAVTASITLPAEPITASTGFFKNSIEGNSFRANWANGDGTGRIVIVRKNSAVTALPVDGVTYTANSNFGAGTAIAADQYVVFDGSSSVCDIKNLEIGATYYIAVFEYNSPGGSPDYLTGSFLSGNATTLSAPATQVTSLNTTAIQSNSVTIGYAAGNGIGRMFIMRQGAAVNVEPTDLLNYSGSSVYGNQEIGTGNYIVQKTTATNNFSVTNLAPNTTYHVAAFEYNGMTGVVFKKPAAVMNFTTTSGSVIVAPTLPATSPVVTNVEGNKLTYKCTEGNGAGRIIVVRAGSAVNFVPVDGVSYSADANFGAGTDVGSNQFILSNGTGNTVNVANLQHSTTYHFAVFEYNGSGSNIKYLTSSFLASNAPTISAPGTGTTNVNKSFSSSTISLNWQNGNGSSRMVIMKEGSPVSSTPTNLSVYPANTIFGSGAQTGIGEYVVYSGSNNSVTVTGLTANKTYYFSIIEFNGNTGPVYNTVNVLTGNATTSASLPVTWLYFNVNLQNNQPLLKWATASEQNSAYFVVERNSGNGFASLDTVKAIGNSGSTTQYNYTDRNPLAGTLLYRLKQADIDGKFVYSTVVSLTINQTTKVISFYPNPTRNIINIRLPINEQQAQLKIHDNKGSLIRQVKLTSNQSTLDLSAVPAGIYFLTIESAGNRLTQKLIKE